MHVHVPAPQNGTAKALSTHTSTESTDGLILFPSLADQDEGLLVQNVYACATRIPPAAGFRHSAGPGSQSPQLLAPGGMSPQGHSPTLTLSADPSPSLSLPLTHTSAVA